MPLSARQRALQNMVDVATEKDPISELIAKSKQQQPSAPAPTMQPKVNMPLSAEKIGSAMGAAQAMGELQQGEIGRRQQDIDFIEDQLSFRDQMDPMKVQELEQRLNELKGIQGRMPMMRQKMGLK